MWSIGERILLTLWVGGMWVIGYVVAPTLFKMLDRVTAGQVAGQLFTVISYIGLCVVVILLIGLIVQAGSDVWRQWRLWALVAILALIAIGQFVLQPMMAELKAAGLSGEAARQFARLHGVASVLYLINSLLGLGLVIWGVSQRH